MPKFSAHLKFFFNNVPYLQRYQAAKNAGFSVVEGGIPEGIDKEAVREACRAAGLYQHHLDCFRGDESKGEFGFAALPGKEKQYKETLLKGIEYAKALDAKLLHITAGYINEPITSKHHETYLKNLKEAIPLLEKANIVGIIEPISKQTRPLYYLNSIERALSVIRTINSPHLKLELDLFHAQLIQGDLTHLIKDIIHDIAHIQIAQVPDRHEPNTPGELNYKYLIDLLDKEGYKGYIGLEYRPLGGTAEGLKWVKEFGYSL